jgi:chromosome segregation ATPase
VDERTTSQREAELEAMLTAANRQLLARDLHVFEFLEARERELAQAHERMAWLDTELDRLSRDVESLNQALAEMRATRVWRLAERYRLFRDRIKTLSSSGARET